MYTIETLNHILIYIVFSTRINSWHYEESSICIINDNKKYLTYEENTN